MADNIYVVDQLVTGTLTVTVTDDGTGSDWLTILGVYATQTDLRLAWSTDAFGNADEAMGLYFNPLNTGHRLVVEGVIENIRGSNGLDFIQGNELGNILYGDQASTGAGDADSIYGYDGHDTIYGGAGGDDIGGANGDDKMYGGDGIDTISGGAGRDTIDGGLGADELAGGSDWGDTVSYFGSNAAVQVSITFGSATTGAGGHAQGDEIFGFTHVIGSAFDDTITDTVAADIGGTQNDNQFNGGAGNDRLFMGGGNDTAFGGTGNDALRGDQGRDSLVGDAGNDTLRGGTENDTLSGGDGNDALVGDTGDDLLQGGLGNDLMRGGTGFDRHYGGTGADTFEFLALSDSTTASAGRDRIYDFSHAEGDRIRLSTIDANANTAPDNAFTFIGTAGYTAGVAGQVRSVLTASGYLVTGDVNGDQVSDFSILVVSSTALVSGDFLL